MTIAVKDGNGSIQTIETLPSKGQALATGSLPFVGASDWVPNLATAAATAAKQDTTNTSLGAPADVAWDGSAGSASHTALLKALWARFSGVVLAAGSAVIGKVGLQVAGADVSAGNPAAVFGPAGAVPTASFTRPSDTTAYAVNDLVANSTTAGSVTPLTLALARVTGGTGAITRVRLGKTGTGVTNASFRVHFYKTTPAFTNGDNGAWLTTTAGYIGSVDVTMDKVFSDGAAGSGVPKDSGGNPCNLNFDAAAGSQNIFVAVQALAAYGPGSAEVFTLSVETARD